MSENLDCIELPFGLDQHVELLKERDIFELSMKDKYGDHWDRRMDTVERRTYNAIETKIDQNDRDRLVSQQKAKFHIQELLETRGLLEGDPYEYEVRDISFSWPNRNRPDRPYGIGIHIVSSDKLSAGSDRIIGYSFLPDEEGKLSVFDVSAKPFTAEYAATHPKFLEVIEETLSLWSTQTWIVDKGSRFQPVHREETEATKDLEAKIRKSLGFVSSYPNMRIQVKGPKGKRPGELRIVFLNIQKMVSIPFVKDSKKGFAIFHPAISSREKW